MNDAIIVWNLAGHVIVIVLVIIVLFILGSAKKNLKKHEDEILESLCEHGKPKLKVKHPESGFAGLSEDDKILLSRRIKPVVKSDAELWEKEHERKQ